MTTVTSHRAPAPARTAAVSPLTPSYGAPLEKDLKAVGDHLGKHWNVKLGKDDAKSIAAARTSVEGLVKKSGLDVERFRALSGKRAGDTPVEQLTRAVYAYGVLAGERYQLSQSGSQIDLINRLREIKSKPPLEDLQVVKPLDFGGALEGLTKAMSRATLKAEPKGWAAYKKTAQEYDEPGPEAKGFKGKPLHSSLGASIGGFGDTTSRASVFYNELRDRSPLNTMLSAVFRQGMNLGVVTLEKPLQAAVDRALVEAGMPRVVGGLTGDRFDR